MPTRLRRLLAPLLVAGGSVVSADRLVDVVWSREQPPRNADGALQNLVSRLRTHLGDVEVPAQVLHRAPGYLLALDPALVDAVCFEERSHAAHGRLPRRCHRPGAGEGPRPPDTR